MTKSSPGKSRMKNLYNNRASYWLRRLEITTVKNQCPWKNIRSSIFSLRTRTCLRLGRTHSVKIGEMYRRPGYTHWGT